MQCKGFVELDSEHECKRLKFNGDCPFEVDWGQERFISREYECWANQRPSYRTYAYPTWLYQGINIVGLMRSKIESENKQ